MATTDPRVDAEASYGIVVPRSRLGVRVTGSLLEARGAVSAAAGVSTSWLSNDDLSTTARELAALKSQVEALTLAVLLEAKDRGRAGPTEDEADPDAAAWLGQLTGDPTEVLRGGLWTAKLLQTRYHHVRTALEDGRLRLTQAKAIVRAAERAPKALTREQITESGGVTGADRDRRVGEHQVQGQTDAGGPTPRRSAPGVREHAAHQARRGCCRG